MFAQKTLMGVVFLAAVCGFAFGLGGREAGAVIPNPCPQWSCATMYAWWSTAHGTPGQTCSAVHLLNSNPPDNTNRTSQAFPLVYTNSGTNNTYSATANKIDQYPYPTHNQTCGYIPGTTTWQSIQEVTQTGKIGKLDRQPFLAECVVKNP
ncbi:MAG: hypothetical protein K2X87_00175 [Gemmataceae bacterium]|nr:hypothetical protein [Gemmataceae bacterium]